MWRKPEILIKFFHFLGHFCREKVNNFCGVRGNLTPTQGHIFGVAEDLGRFALLKEDIHCDNQVIKVVVMDVGARCVDIRLSVRDCGQNVLLCVPKCKEALDVYLKRKGLVFRKEFGIKRKSHAILKIGFINLFDNFCL